MSGEISFKTVSFLNPAGLHVYRKKQVKIDTTLARVAPLNCTFSYKYLMPPALGCTGVPQSLSFAPFNLNVEPLKYPRDEFLPL